MSAARYPHVFSPIKLGPVEVKNRFYFSPHGNPYHVGPGPSDAFAYYYGERALGGCGLAIHALSVMPRRAIGITPYVKESIPQFRAAADHIHRSGAKLFAEIHYSKVTNGWRYEAGSPPAPVFSPSAVQIFDGFHVTNEASVATIERIIDAHRVSSANLAEAGYDGIEIHCSHGMLAEAFLSPYFNHRTDDWGGSLENRMRFLVEVLKASRAGAGPNLAVGMRYNVDEMMPGGLGQADTREILERIVDMKLLDFVDMDISIEPDQHPFGMPNYFIQGHLYESFVKNVRSAAGSVPVLSVLGRVTTIATAERAIAQGTCDLVGAARGLMAEPDLVKNAAEGREEDSRVCLACNLCMSGTQGCAINPGTGREKYWGGTSFTPAARRSKVVVVGGGPAGLEAARVAARKGHEVVLMERRAKVGGQLNLWASLPGREVFYTTPAWYERQLTKYGVDVRTGVTATAATVLAEKPDAVVVATGSTYLRTGQSGFMVPPIPGHERAFVYIPEQILEDGLRPSGRVLLLDEEGFNTGAGVAEVLAEAGAEVTIVTRWLQPVQEMVKTFEYVFVLARLKGLGVKFRTETYIKEIGDRQVTVFDVLTNEEEVVTGVDAVVLATSRRADTSLARALEGKVRQLFVVGDALAPRALSGAIYEGQRFARLIGERDAPRDFAEDFFSPVDASILQRPATALGVPELVVKR